jgi:hypothetical protein
MSTRRTLRLQRLALWSIFVSAGGCSSKAVVGPVDLSGTGGNAADAGMFAVKKVFVITLENQASANIYGNAYAPFLNTLLKQGGHAAMYDDVLPASIPSEPHYVWMEAGTNVFADRTFTNDDDPSATNSTSSRDHLVTQMGALPTPKTWRSYQESLNTETGACPIESEQAYAAKHDPFVFFQDVAGNPPDKSSPLCVLNHRAYSEGGLKADLIANDVADYTFITPDLCNDMHGGLCTNGCVLGSITPDTCIGAADNWLAKIVPSILEYCDAHDGVLMIVWDEPEDAGTQPFVIVGPHVKPGYTSGVPFSHSSYLKTLQRIMGVPIYANVMSANDFSDFYDTAFAS